MDKVLLFLGAIGALAILAQWYVFQSIRKYIFQEYEPITRRTAYFVLILFGILNFIAVRVTLGSDVFGPDTFGQRVAEATFFTYLGIIIMLSLFFLVLDLISTSLSWKDRILDMLGSSAHQGVARPNERGFLGHGVKQDPPDAPGDPSFDPHLEAESTITGSPEAQPLPNDQRPGSSTLPSPGRRTFFKWSAGAAVAFAAGFAGKGLAQGYGRPVIEEFDLFHSKLQGLTEDVTIIQITDFHFGMFMGTRELERVVAMINEIDADAVFITGDIFHSPQSPVELAVPVLRKLRPRRIGNFAIMGNHDFYAGEWRSVKNIKASHLTLLRDEWITVNHANGTIHIGGIDDPLANWVWGQDFPEFQIFKDKAPTGPGMRLLLSHRPSVLPVAAAAGMDFVLAGHTHGGQVIFPAPGINKGLSIASLVSDYTHGWYRKGSSRMYLNRGTGLTFLPWRVGCPPEIAVFHLKPPGSEQWSVRRSVSGGRGTRFAGDEPSAALVTQARCSAAVARRSD